MATSDATISWLLDQLASVDGIAARKMFGEYGLSRHGKPVGVICNNVLFLKITPRGRELAPDAAEEPPYRGARPSLRIEPEWCKDAERLAALVRATADALPQPKPRKREAG